MALSALRVGVSMACGSVVAVARPAFTLEAGDESPDTDRHRDDLLAIIAEIEAEESSDGSGERRGGIERRPRGAPSP